jgi:Lrp/AsnC family transcriptional regulator, regulator for asnA, asnC and gidA
MNLDGKDLAIVEILRDNSRASIRDIARKTKIRPSTVHLRIQRMIKEGIIEKFTLKLNPKAIGENFVVFVLVTTSQDLSEEFLGNSHIKGVFGVTGEYDLLLELKFKDVEEFNDFLISFRKEKNIKKTLTMVVTTKVKDAV